jgi:DNA-binding GntR family transcriptional regulator
MMHQTKADYAAARMREALATGKFAPGERLQPKDIARELELSLTPVREALIELAAEGLIDIRPHRGPHVASAKVESLEEIYLLRETLEGLAVTLAVERVTDDELAEIVELHEQFVAAHEAGALTELAALSDRFHLAIYTAAKTPMLVRLIKIVMTSAPSGILATIPDRAERSLADHQKLVDAITARDADTAKAVMQQHLHETLGFVNEFQKSGPADSGKPKQVKGRPRRSSPPKQQ